MSLRERCETALAGFVAIDVYRLLADRKCAERKLPKGSLFMASQTASTVQLCGLSVAIMCLTKDPAWDPWRAGHGRASEASVEQHFGFLRKQSANAQLSARAYWQASARQSLRMNKVLQKQAPVTKGEPSLTPEELLGRYFLFRCVWIIFVAPGLVNVILYSMDRVQQEVYECIRTFILTHTDSYIFIMTVFDLIHIRLSLRFEACCKKALCSALRLVSKTSGYDEGELERMYRTACKDGCFQAWSDAALDADELPEEKQEDGADQCFELVDRIRREMKFSDPDTTLAEEADVDIEDPEKDEFKDMPCGNLIEAMLEASFEEDSAETAKNPRTLMQAIDRSARESDHVFWNSLWRLSLHLRSSVGGMDQGWIPNAKNCRVASRDLNWHQWLGLIGSIFMFMYVYIINIVTPQEKSMCS